MMPSRDATAREVTLVREVRRPKDGWTLERFLKRRRVRL